MKKTFLKKICTYVLFMFSFLGYCQEKKLSKEETELIYEICYNFTKDIFSKPKYFFKKKSFNDQEYFPISKNKKAVLEQATDSLSKFAKIKFDNNEHFSSVIMNSKFPSFFEENAKFSSNIISIEVLKSFLWDKNHDSIKISDGGGTSFGTDFKYILKDNKEKNLNYITVNRQSQITKPSQPKEPIKGKIDYVIKVITDYDKVTLNAKETGRKFTLNGNVYTLKYVFENKIVIEKEKEDRETEINIINFSSDNKKILVPKTLDDTLTEKEKKEFWEISAVKKGSYYKKIFDFFSENPNSSLEEFKSNFPIEKLLKEKETYFIISITSPIENDFILYSPIYGFQKEFSLDL